MITLTQFFIRFLKENNVYTLYVNNFIKQRNINNISIKTIEIFLKKYNANIIDSSLIWRQTNEGSTLWSLIDDKWRREYYKFEYHNDC